jgi:hypothetical protein
MSRPASSPDCGSDPTMVVSAGAAAPGEIARLTRRPPGRMPRGPVAVQSVQLQLVSAVCERLFATTIYGQAIFKRRRSEADVIRG